MPRLSSVVGFRLAPVFQSIGAAVLLVGLGAPHAAAQIVLAGFTFDDNAGPDRVVPLPGSQPEFDGTATGCVFGPTLPGLSLDESLQAVMLSDSVSNWVRGRAVFRLDFEDNAIVNDPGPDLVVFELGQAENFELRVLDHATCAWSDVQSYSPQSTPFAVPCAPPNTINARAIDLDDFGLPPGALVRSVLLDNGGGVGSTTGADLMQVMAQNSTAPVTAAPCLLGFQQGISGLGSSAYSGSVDTALASAAPTTNFSAAPLEFVDASPYRSVLVRFGDLVGSAAWQIPPGSDIRSATLHLATGGGDSSSSSTHAVHGLLQAWNAETITYASGFGGNGVQVDGLEAAATAAGSIPPMSNNDREEVDVTSTVQAWVQGALNEGLLLHPLGGDGLGLHLSEAAVATLRPALSIVLETLSWVDLGGSLAGTNGPPHFAATGELAAGQPFQLTVSNGVPSGSATLVLGTSVLNAPVKGGIMVPSPLVLVPGLALDPAGTLALPAVWPGAPAGLDIVIQFWIADAGGPKGFAATNARKAVTQ